MARTYTCTAHVLTLLGLAASASGQDPFAAGERWNHCSTAAAAWIPQSVGFTARESLVWAAGAGSGGSVMLLDSAAQGDHHPRLRDPAATQGVTHLTSTAGSDHRHLFTLAQRANPTKFARSTTVTCHTDPATSTPADFGESWSHDVGFNTNGPARLAVDLDGGRVLVAVWNSSTHEVQFDWLDGSSGALLSRTRLPGLSLECVDVSDDGDRAVVTAGLDLYVIDETGLVLHHEPLVVATPAAAISGDGRTLAVGGAGQLSVLREVGGTWTHSFSVTASSQELAARADLSRRGRILGVAWWDSTTGVDLRLEAWDTISRQALNTHSVSGTPGGPQNMAEVIEVTPDGRRVAFGTWGNGTSPELLLFQTGTAEPLLQVDLPGSVRALDLEDGGTRMVVGYQDAHRNVFTKTGGIAMMQTAERTLVQLTPAELGSDLHLATRLDSASVALLLSGQRSDPVALPGVLGLLYLDRKTLSCLGETPLAGRADFFLFIPDDPSLVGTHIALQPAFRVRGRTSLSSSVLEPILLH